jgi:putative Holliday junction resolvase
MTFWLLPQRGYKLEGRSRKLESLPQPRYLGLDVGNRRIGVAVSDELGLTAQPVLTLERRHSRREDLRSLARLARRFGVAGIVVGNPVHLSGGVSPQAARTQAFAAELGELTGLPIHLWDERLTTHEAHQILYEAGHARQRHRRVVDQVAATLILQSFMDERKAGPDRYGGVAASVPDTPPLSRQGRDRPGSADAEGGHRQPSLPVTPPEALPRGSR